MLLVPIAIYNSNGITYPMYTKVFSFVSEYAHRYATLCWYAGLFGLAILSRVVFQPLPSVDPLLPIMFFAGAKLSWKKAGLLAATAYFASNFVVIGGQGYWTIPMVMGAFVVGACGSIFKKRKLFGITLGTIAYEGIVNLMMVPFFNPLLAIPFSLTHIVTNALFVHGGKKLTKALGASRT